MSRLRRTPRQVRRRYLAALAMLPLLVPEPVGTDPNGLPVLAAEYIGGRVTRFAAITGQPRLRVTFADAEPVVLGSVIGLDGNHPELRVSTPIYMEWAATHATALIAAATRTWAAHQHHCDH